MVHEDRYLYFTYNGVHSSDLGVFYINRGEDISLPFTSNATRKFASPLYQNISYKLGKNEEPRAHRLQLAADHRNLNEVQDIIEWLSAGDFGKLVFDYRPDYQFNVVVDKIKPPTIIPYEFPNNVIKHIALLEVDFITFGDHFIETREPYIVNSISSGVIKNLYEPDELLPIYKKSGNKDFFINWSSVRQHFDIINIGTSVKVSKIENNKEEVYYHYSNLPTSTVSIIKTDLGVALYGNKLLEKSFSNSLVKNKGPMPIKSGLIFSGNIKVSNAGSNLEIQLDNRFKNFNSNDKLFVYIEKELDEDTKLQPNQDPRFWFKGYYEQKEDMDSIPRIQLPQVSEAVVSSDLKRITFSNSGHNLETGNYKVKIAVGTEFKIETTGGDATLEFRYRKGV